MGTTTTKAKPFIILLTCITSNSTEIIYNAFWKK